MPTVVIPDAAIHSGQITVRKSDQFELQTDTMIGISRIDISEARKVQSKGELLFQPTVFQAFEFSRTPFSVAIRSRPKKDQMEVIARSLIDIREKTCGLETRFIFSTPTPRHEITIELPGDLEIQKINTAVRFRKSVVSIDGKKILIRATMRTRRNATKHITKPRAAPRPRGRVRGESHRRIDGSGDRENNDADRRGDCWRQP